MAQGISPVTGTAVGDGALGVSAVRGSDSDVSAAGRDAVGASAVAGGLERAGALAVFTPGRLHAGLGGPTSLFNSARQLSGGTTTVQRVTSRPLLNRTTIGTALIAYISRILADGKVQYEVMIWNRATLARPAYSLDRSSMTGSNGKQTGQPSL